MRDELEKDLLEHIKEAEKANAKLDEKISFHIFHSDIGLRVCIGNSDCIVIDRIYRIDDFGYTSCSDFRKDIFGILEKELCPSGNYRSLGFGVD